jgi:hypothetical protein
VARKNILAARKSATKIRGGVTMVASCVRGLTALIYLDTAVHFGIVCKQEIGLWMDPQISLMKIMKSKVPKVSL